MDLTLKKLGLDLRLSKIVRDDLKDFRRLERLRKDHFETRPVICLELPRLITRYMKKEDDPDDSPELRAGKLYRYVLEHKQPHIFDDNLLLGTTTGKKKGVVLYPDVLGMMTIWPELETISHRAANPFDIGPKAIRELNEEILPYWLEKGSIAEWTRRRHGNPWCQQIMERIIFFAATKVDTITHTIPNYQMLLTDGLQAIIDRAREKEQDAGTQEQRDFYRAVWLSLEAVLDYARRLSEEAARRAGMETDPVRRAELEKMCQICRRVPAQPPETFHEAVNSLWIYHVALHQENINIGLSPGRLDQVLYPAFKEELKRRRQSGINAARDFLQEAVELVGCLWLKLVDHVAVAPESSEEMLGGTGCNQAVTLGGVDLKGEDAVNDLTYVILRVTELLRLRDPNVNARYHVKKNSDEYLRRLGEVNIMTGATPCFQNDEAIIKNLERLHRDQGASKDKARRHANDYGIVGCVEPESCGRTFGHPGSIMFSLPSVLELALFQGKHRATGDWQVNPDPKATPPPAAMRSFAEFQEAFATQLRFLVGQAVELNNMFGQEYQRHHPFPLMSALMEGCFEKGQDVINGGARYNFSGAWIIGLAEVVDSLTAIQEFVFEAAPPRRTSFGRLLKAIENDWQGYRYLQTLCKKSPDKFGNDSAKARANAEWLIDTLHTTFDDTLKEQPHYRGGKYRIGYYTMTTHAGLGKNSGALPSGRQQGESFPSGITPVSGAAPDLMNVLHFVADLGRTGKILNGQALNLRFDPDPATAPKYAACIKGYFQCGGLQVQSNIIDVLELRQANEEPEKYPELFVRVSGYSAYFKDLNRAMRQEIIDRAEYGMSITENESEQG